MNIHLISFGDNKFSNSKIRLKNQAYQSNFFNEITIYDENDLDDDFRNKFKEILKYKKGNGFYLWKIYLIHKTLKKLNENDILIYIDSGSTINENGKKKFNEYIELIKNNNIVCFETGYPEIQYTTNKIFQKFSNINNEVDIYNSSQIVANLLIIKKCENTSYIFSYLLDLVYYNQKIITDIYNNDINNSDKFITNRHDQSLISLAIKVFGKNIYIIKKDETYFTNFGSNESMEYPFWATRIRH